MLIFIQEDTKEKGQLDLSLLEGKKVNKVAYLVNECGKLFSRVVDGNTDKLVGRKSNAHGNI